MFYLYKEVIYRFIINYLVKLLNFWGGGTLRPLSAGFGNITSYCAATDGGTHKKEKEGACLAFENCLEVKCVGEKQHISKLHFKKPHLVSILVFLPFIFISIFVAIQCV